MIERLREEDDAKLLRFFDYEHLPSALRKRSQPFYTLALDLIVSLPPSTERTNCLRKLLEAKDSAVRCAL